MQGIGNDYIYINCFEEKAEDPQELSRRLSDRHFGIGGDGIVLIMPSEKADFRMRIFNADGSEAKMCGNATRCIGKYVYDRGLTSKKTVTLETESGIKTLQLFTENDIVKTVLVDMGKAVLKPADIPMRAEGERFVHQVIDVSGTSWAVTCVSMGNPHCVAITDRDVSSLDLESIGPAFENHTLFPDRVNTEFVNVKGDGTAVMRVWERGSGETLACGTGACAVTAACVLEGYFERDMEHRICLRGGDLFVRYASDGHVPGIPGEVDVNISFRDYAKRDTE